jgi:benzoylformate decarboxylase
VGSVREATLDLLRSFGMTTIFGNPGSTELPFLEDLPEDFSYVLGLQEAVVLAMADGFAQAQGRATLVNLHTAPGLGNAMGAMVNAYHGRTPLVVTAGQQDRRHLALEPLLHGRLVELAKPYVKWSHEPARAEDVPAAIARAYHTATQEPQGPVFVSIPMDDWEAEAPPLEARWVSQRTAPDPEALERVAGALRESRRPAIVAGDGAARCGAWHEVVALAERLNAPVWNQPLSARASFPQDHPLFQGHLASSRRSLSRQLAGHDVVLVLGAAVFKYYPYAAGPVVEPGTHVLQVTDDPNEAARAATGSSVVGNVALATRRLRELLPAAERPAPPAPPRPETPEAAHPIPVTYLMHVLGRVLPEDAVVVNESLSSEGELRRHVPITRPDSFYGGASSGGGIGFGMPGAVGVQLAVPERPVVSVVGDGSAMYTVQALWTAARLMAPVTYVIVNNSQYAILKAFAASTGIPDKVPGLDLPQLDITRIAEGFGCKAETVEEPERLEEALVRALAHEGPYLLNVMVDRAVPDLLA